jgi:hypothetical protein
MKEEVSYVVEVYRNDRPRLCGSVVRQESTNPTLIKSVYEDYSEIFNSKNTVIELSRIRKDAKGIDLDGLVEGIDEWIKKDQEEGRRVSSIKMGD